MLKATCGNCGKVYQVKDEYAGRKFACKQCGKPMRVAGVASAGASPVAAAPVLRSVPKPPPVPVAVQAAPDSGDVDFDALASLESTGDVDNTIPMVQSTPSPRAAAALKKPSLPSVKMPRLGFRFNRLVLGLIVGGIMLAVYGGREMQLSSGATETPQDISCADLAANGPGDNAHIRVTNFLSLSNYVYQHDEAGKWLTTWLPIVPREAIKKPVVFKGAGKIIPNDLVDSGDIHVLIKTHIVTSEGNLGDAMHRDSVEGMVINKIEKVPQEEQDLLHQAYPALSLDNCWILEDGREPKSGVGLGMLGGGVVLALLGLVAMFKPAR